MKNKDYAKELAALNLKAGELTANNVIAKAKPKRSALHDYFLWDDKKASHKYRVIQADALIRSVKVVVSTSDRGVFKVSQYVRNPEKPGNEQGYLSIFKLKNDDELKREVIVAEFSRAASALRRARDLAAYFDIDQAIDDAISSVERLQIPGDYSGLSQ